jgi:hypothetical protein
MNPNAIDIAQMLLNIYDGNINKEIALMYACMNPNNAIDIVQMLLNKYNGHINH